MEKEGKNTSSKMLRRLRRDGIWNTVEGGLKWTKESQL